MATPTPSFKDLIQHAQVGGKKFISTSARRDIYKLGKTNPLLKQAFFGRKLTQRQEIQALKTLQAEDKGTFSQRSARTLYSEKARELAAKERLASNANKSADAHQKEDWATRYAKKREEAKRVAVETTMEGRAVAAEHREQASKGRIQETIHEYARQQESDMRIGGRQSSGTRRYAVSALEKQRESQQKKAAMDRIANKDPRQLAKFANPLF